MSEREEETPTRQELGALRSEIQQNTELTRQVLKVLQGPIGKPKEGLVSRVDHVEERVETFEKLKDSAVKAAWASVIGALTTLGGLVVVALKTAWAKGGG